LPVIPNLEGNKDYVWIDLTSILSKNGQDILDRESTFEKDIFFKGLNLSKETQPFEYLSDHRQVHYIAGAKSSDAKTIKGTLFFKIPLDSKNSSNFYEKSYPFIKLTFKKIKYDNHIYTHRNYCSHHPLAYWSLQRFY